MHKITAEVDVHSTLETFAQLATVDRAREVGVEHVEEQLRVCRRKRKACGDTFAQRAQACGWVRCDVGSRAAPRSPPAAAVDDCATLAVLVPTQLYCSAGWGGADSHRIARTGQARALLGVARARGSWRRAAAAVRERRHSLAI